jgi:hypothetical protein
MTVNLQPVPDAMKQGIYIYIYIYIYGVPQTEASGGSRRRRKVTIMGGRCCEREDAEGGRGTS